MTFEPKKPPIYLPEIAPKDYDAFRKILGQHIPDTYSEWLDLVKQWEDHHKDDDVRHVKINQQKFSQYLADTSRAPTLNELFVFAAAD